MANRGRALVLAGAQQPVAVHLMVMAINSALGAIGSTLTGIAEVSKPAITIEELANDISGKKVSTLIILGGNPVYNAPADLDWAKLQQSVPNVIRVGFHEDETSATGDMERPGARITSSTGATGAATDGTYVAVQPMILPLFGGWSDNDVLAVLAGMPKPVGPELVQETFKQIAPAADFDAAWNKFLHDGFQAGSSSGTARTPFFLSAAAVTAIGQQANLTALGRGGDLRDCLYAGLPHVRRAVQ